MIKHLFKFTLIALLGTIGLQASAQVVLLVQEPSNLAGSYDFTYSSSNNWGGRHGHRSHYC